jgi:hypothetical protein
MNAENHRDKRSEELNESELDSIAGGATSADDPPPIDDEREPRAPGEPIPPDGEILPPPPDGAI